MIVYEYKCSCGEKIEKVFKKIPQYKPSKYITCKKCGARAEKVITLPSTDIGGRVRYSSSLGVNPRQIPEAMRKYPGSEYDKKGRLIIKNRKHKLQEMKKRGMVEFD